MLPTEFDAQAQRRTIDALHAKLQAMHPDQEVVLHETHISFVLVTAGFAYKFKKALKNDFLDFTTLALRRHFCNEELRLNRRLAPELYLDVVAVTGPPHDPALEGSGPPIDCAVRMRAFDQAGLWDRRAAQGLLGPAQIDALVAQLVAFHSRIAVAGAPGADDPTRNFGGPAQVRRPMLDNLGALPALLPGEEEHDVIESLSRWEAATYTALEPVFAERQRGGWVRECHGDLHLGNVAEIEGRTTVFDGIEFNDEFRWIDVMSEIAFMAMDLHAHGRSDLAHRFVNGCVEASGDYEGLRVLRYYEVHRALVRAKVAAIRAGQTGHAADRAQARHFLALAAALSRRGQPALLITHGHSGSGKTTLSQGLLETLGAVRVRADLERKRMFGLKPLQRGKAVYGADATAATYARLGEAAQAVLDAGLPVVLDATFLRRQHRDMARGWAAARGLPFVLLDFELDPATLRERVSARAARNDDASDADIAVLERQLQTADSLGSDERAGVFSCHATEADGQFDWTPLLERLRGPRLP